MVTMDVNGTAPTMGSVNASIYMYQSIQTIGVGPGYV